MAPNINKEKCVGCGACVNACPVAVLEVKDGKAIVVNAEACLGCRACQNACPHEAVSFDE